jgi:hypothetical protein
MDDVDIDVGNADSRFDVATFVIEDIVALGCDKRKSSDSPRIQQKVRETYSFGDPVCICQRIQLAANLIPRFLKLVMLLLQFSIPIITLLISSVDVLFLI